MIFVNGVLNRYIFLCNAKLQSANACIQADMQFYIFLRQFIKRVLKTIKMFKKIFAIKFFLEDRKKYCIKIRTSILFFRFCDILNKNKLLEKT